MTTTTTISFVATAQPTDTATSSPPHFSDYSVRSLTKNDSQTQTPDVKNGENEPRRVQSITFSDDGIPYKIPLLSIQLFETPGTLNVDSLRAIQRSMEEYLMDKLTEEFNDNNTSNATASSEEILTDVTITILNDRSITTPSRRRRRLGSQQQRKLRQGSEIDMQVVLDFASQPIPSDNEIELGVSNVLANMTDFVGNYLLIKTDELVNVDTAIYDASSFTAAPSSSPSMAPTAEDLDVSQANREGGQPVSLGGSSANTRTLYLAVVAGVGAMLLTMMILANGKRRVRDLDDSVDQSVDEIIEIGADGGASISCGSWNPSFPSIHDDSNNMVMTDQRNEMGTDKDIDVREWYDDNIMMFPGHNVILSKASSTDSDCSDDDRYNVMDERFNVNYNVVEHVLPRIHYGSGEGYPDSVPEEKESSSPRRNQFLGSFKRVDMTGEVEI